MNRTILYGHGYAGIFAHKNTNVEIWNGTEYTSANIAEPKNSNYVTIHFGGGHNITCKPNQLFKIKDEWIPAKELKRKNKLQLTNNVVDFDFLNLDSFSYLKNLTPLQVGVLVGTRINYGKLLNKFTPTSFNVPAQEYVLRNVLHEIFQKCGVAYREDELHQAKQIRKLYNFQELQFLQEIDSFIVDGMLSEACWKSKVFLLGFLKVMFNRAINERQKFQIKLKKNFAQQLQQMLHLFGVRAKRTEAFLFNSIIIEKFDLYKFAVNVSIFNDDRLLLPLSSENFVKFNKQFANPLTLEIDNVIIHDKEIEMCDIVTDGSYVLDGLVSKNI